MAQIKRYGWWPSLPDKRNLVHDFAGAPVADSPVDLRATGFLGSVWDQGQLGSCTAHGTGKAYVFDLAKTAGAADFDGSRLFQYYNSRLLEGSTDSDSGATVADAIKALNGYGFPPAADWPYDIGQFAAKPPDSAYADGKLREAVKYAQVPQSEQAMKACLTAGIPFVIGFTVYASFESDQVAQDGIVPMPSAGEQVLGGHCVLCVGWKQINGQDYWILMNSWGSGWADKGFFYMPKAYLLDSSLSDDFWTVQSVSSPDPGPQPPKPTPGPSPDGPSAADQALWSGVKTWVAAHHAGTTKPIAQDLKKWAQAKGLIG